MWLVKIIIILSCENERLINAIFILIYFFRMRYHDTIRTTTIHATQIYFNECNKSTTDQPFTQNPTAHQRSHLCVKHWISCYEKYILSHIFVIVQYGTTVQLCQSANCSRGFVDEAKACTQNICIEYSPLTEYNWWSCMLWCNKDAFVVTTKYGEANTHVTSVGTVHFEGVKIANFCLW
jgi:hypothetical protein